MFEVSKRFIFKVLLDAGLDMLCLAKQVKCKFYTLNFKVLLFSEVKWNQNTF